MLGLGCSSPKSGAIKALSPLLANSSTPLLGPGVADLAAIEDLADQKDLLSKPESEKTQDEIKQARRLKAEKQKKDKELKQKLAAERIAENNKKAAESKAQKPKPQHVPRNVEPAAAAASPTAGVDGSKERAGDARTAQKNTRATAPQNDNVKKVKKGEKVEIVKRIRAQKQVALFSHLNQWEHQATSLSLKVGYNPDDLHPSVVRAGLQIASGAIIGSNARAVALLIALKDFIGSYKTPPTEMLSRDMEKKIQPIVRFFHSYRDKSISMGNAIRYVKAKVGAIPPGMDEEDAKAELMRAIDSFISDRIINAQSAIADFGTRRISNGDVVLTYGMSSVVERILIQAQLAKINFRVIIVDARPKLEGKVLLARLVAAGVSCCYVLLPALGYVLSTVNKAFLGAHAMLANGAAVARVGTAVVGVMAKEYNVPVLICCESYKFSQSVQVRHKLTSFPDTTDAFVCRVAAARLILYYTL
jgi:translation initiation factor eIF-2B subunit delta